MSPGSRGAHLKRRIWACLVNCTVLDRGAEPEHRPHGACSLLPPYPRLHVRGWGWGFSRFSPSSQVRGDNSPFLDATESLETVLLEGLGAKKSPRPRQSPEKLITAVTQPIAFFYPPTLPFLEGPGALPGPQSPNSLDSAGWRREEAGASSPHARTPRCRLTRATQALGSGSGPQSREPRMVERAGELEVSPSREQSWVCGSEEELETPDHIHTCGYVCCV